MIMIWPSIISEYQTQQKKLKVKRETTYYYICTTLLKQISTSKMASALFFTCLITCSVFLLTIPCYVANQKVTLSLYYDSLSTSCATFIVKNLAKIFDDDLITILNLRLVPWGDAYANKSNNSTAFCQHRPDGCKLNFLEACAIDVMHDVNKHFALIYCIEFWP
ncbi:putative gamma interferon inducible lysosomal thiol reductase GILT [Rosa chinensis]|uniref:Putative gamma interferon inducible lysosomal thiol reductase GILT n=1 Tax=Rosa chinensis TaxID=74649 RepID=A0A2P6PC45_ROSCH|nr:putative gamma interferon inducible lysosomal thiol reductase GILT [Rosa chinensis]